MPLKFKKASADEARSKRKEHVKDVAGGTAIVKGFNAPPSWNEDARSARFIMSSETVDRYSDIVVQAGIDLTNFVRNPQGLLFHNSRTWPIGNWSDITKVLSGRPKRTEGVLNFLPEGIDDDADRAARHVKAGSIRTVSIGFIPNWEEVDFILDEDEDWTGGFRFNACELIECSLVPIPAQPDAVVKDASGDMKLARDIIEDILDSYTKTPEGLLVPLDAYRETHAEISGNRKSIVVNRDLLPKIKAFVPQDDLKIKATTESEAEEFVGAKVMFDPAHPENKGWPFDSALSKAVGEVIASWIVEEGEFKGAHGLAVEFLTDDYDGMFRGIAAERFLLVKSDEGEAEDPDDFEDPEMESDMEDDNKSSETDETANKSVALQLEVSVDSNIAETKKQVEELESVVDRVLSKIGKIFGRSKEPPAPEKKEPELTIEPEIKEPPTAEQVAVAKANAAALRERLISKGMIAAE